MLVLPTLIGCARVSFLFNLSINHRSQGVWGGGSPPWHGQPTISPRGSREGPLGNNKQPLALN